MEYQNLLVDDSSEIVMIKINRPKALNAISQGVMQELNYFFSEHLNDFKVRGVILTGEGEKAFAAGADIKGFDTNNAQKSSELSKYGQDTFFKIENFHAPVIAVVNGFALGGGCELAMACHMRIGEEHARFGQPEVNLGLITGFGGSQRLGQIIGKSKAIELLLTADMIKAEEALQLGLINYSVASGAGIDKAQEILAKVASKGPIAVKEMITCFNAAFDESRNGYKEEYEAFGNTMITEDCKEGVSAFIEKRKADFKGV